LSASYTLRNEIGHELFRVIADDEKNPLTLGNVLTTFGIYVKIVRWWVKEFEAAIDPDSYENADFEQVESADTMSLRVIIQKSLSTDSEWEEITKLLTKPPAG